MELSLTMPGEPTFPMPSVQGLVASTWFDFPNAPCMELEVMILTQIDAFLNHPN